MSGKDTQPQRKHHARNTRGPSLPRPTRDALHTPEEPDLLALQRAVARPDLARPADILALQRTVGNRAVQRLLAQSRDGQKGYALDDETAGRINQARSRSLARQWDRALNPALAGQPFSASARFGGTGVLQRALKYKDDGPVPPGSIVACENPTFLGRQMVGRAAGLYTMKGEQEVRLRHAAIVAKTPGYVYESMGSGIERNADRYMQGQPILVMAPPASPIEVLRAARYAYQAKLALVRRWWRPRGAAGERYHRRLALLAVEKGKLERKLDYYRKLERVRQLKRWETRRKRDFTTKLQRLERRFQYPPLLQAVLDRVRPSGHTYCVLFVIQCVQAALRNMRKVSEAKEWIDKMGPAPHVRDLVKRWGPRKRWAEWWRQA